jgi:hypothetical protein
VSARPSIRFFDLPQAMRPATCEAGVACDGRGEATVLVQENVPGGVSARICRPCYEDFTATHDPLPDDPHRTREERH